MSDSLRMTDPSLSPSQAVHVDRVCDAFEAAWRAGERPPIEQCLGDTAEPARTALLRELVRLEVELSGRRSGEPPARLEDYLGRFPELADWLPLLFRQVTPICTSTVPETPRPEAAAGPPPEPSTLAPQEPVARPTDLLAIPGYRVLGEIDEGGMGIVYKARQEALNRVVALKMIRAGLHAEPQELARFRVEAEAVARLSHRNVIRIHDFGEVGGRPYFSMEFVDGGSLADRLDGAPLSPTQAAQLLETLARAMHYVHEQNIIHRDLKPANILLARSDPAAAVPLGGADDAGHFEPKISDFGLARRLDERLRKTAPGAVMGTASYMAPEQADPTAGEVGQAADVYGLGAILYETLTGQPPFRAPTRELTLLKVLTEDPVPPTRLRPEVPHDLEAVCLKCLEKDPAKRYASALALADDLRAFREGGPLSVQPSGEWDWQARWARRAGYEILELTGAGVLGLSYKARHVGLNRVVTLKTIAAQAQVDPEKMERFRVEAQAAARLLHPNIVQVYDFGEQGGQPYFSLEFVDGGCLADQCTGSPRPAREAAELIATLARAVHHAHEQKIVHSDLRPFNVLLTAGGVPKITGFGLARLLEEGRVREHPGPRRTVSNYMAPEQADGRGAIGPPTDVHALGAMLYEMLTGRPPFLADSVQATLEQIGSAEPAPPSQVQPGVPPELDTICRKCLRKDPAQRYATAQTLAEDLRRALARNDVTTREFELIPDYELVEQLGQGGIGVVYKARQVSLDRVVALKLFRQMLGSVLAANQAVARLHHPNLVPIYACGEREDLLYVVEELVEGTTLARKAAGRPQPPREAAALLETLARAMHYVHGHGIVHRNLKPSVILLTAFDVPKIGSFDLARLGQRGEGEEEGRIIGTPAYMAPEQAAGRTDEIGPATDVYGLGAILYELLAGRPPFQAGEVLELFQQVQEQEPVPPSRAQPGVPRDLEAVCLKCLRKQPAERYPSALALAEDLQCFLSGKRLSTSSGGGWRDLFGWLTRRS